MVYTVPEQQLPLGFGQQHLALVSTLDDGSSPSQLEAEEWVGQ
jgi:hypothetical protein